MNQSPLAPLGQTIERILSCRASREYRPVPVLGIDESGNVSLLDIVQDFNPDTWTVDRLEGAVYRRSRAPLAENEYASSLPVHLEWKAVVMCVMRTREKQPRVSLDPIQELPDDYTLRSQISALIGEDLGKLLLAFTGRQFTDGELADMERTE